MNEEPRNEEPRPVVAEESAPAEVQVGGDVENVVEVSQGRAEPTQAIRTGPFAIASFVVAILALWQSPQALGLVGRVGAFSGDVNGLLVFVSATILPLTAAGLAVWLAGRGEEEIAQANGTLGGTGWCVSARVISYVVLAIIAVAVVMQLLTNYSPQQVGA